ncbi:MAG TPA: hypothetical protein VMW17_14495 [Candidatus Binatia bacterium]|nr:hypothetical protein [Candidatus Binatia bacterium]
MTRSPAAKLSKMVHRRSVVSSALLIWMMVCGRAVGQTPDTCVGDCDHNNKVTVDELVVGVNIALGSLNVELCRALDPDMNDRVEVDALVKAVNNSLVGCPGAPTVTPIASTTTPSPTATLPPTLTPTATATETASATPQTGAHFCDLPGSLRFTESGTAVVPGGPPAAPSLSFLHLPAGFCAHYFATIGNARQLRFAPGGELFVASPTRTTGGGGPNGKAAIMVLPDDDGDGLADTSITFLGGISATQGLLFVPGYFYYQNDTKIMRMPYASGDRTPSAASEQVANITVYVSSLHWPKALDIADDGTIYASNGGDQFEACDPTHPFHGGILKLDGSPGGAPVAKGFRNPISLRCSRGHNLCFAIELTRDFSTTQGGREKLVPIRQDDDWGFPCCATKDLPFPDIRPVPDCSTVAAENNSFIVGDTPFDLDFEAGKWPAPWGNRVYVPLHGAVSTWIGARVVAVELDSVTGELLPGSDITGTGGAMKDFATGWDDRTLSHGRPSAAAFAPDGRLFLANDANGVILWIAPLDL